MNLELIAIILDRLLESSLCHSLTILIIFYALSIFIKSLSISFHIKIGEKEQIHNHYYYPKNEKDEDKEDDEPKEDDKE